MNPILNQVNYRIQPDPATRYINGVREIHVFPIIYDGCFTPNQPLPHPHKMGHTSNWPTRQTQLASETPANTFYLTGYLRDDSDHIRPFNYIETYAEQALLAHHGLRHNGRYTADTCPYTPPTA